MAFDENVYWPPRRTVLDYCSTWDTAMEEVIRNVRLILGQRFPGATLDIVETVPGQKVGGSIIASDFDDLDMVDRQTVVWDELRGRLPREFIRNVGMILTLTPVEVQSWTASAAA